MSLQPRYADAFDRASLGTLDDLGEAFSTTPTAAIEANQLKLTGGSYTHDLGTRPDHFRITVLAAPDDASAAVQITLLAGTAVLYVYAYPTATDVLQVRSNAGGTNHTLASQGGLHGTAMLLYEVTFDDWDITVTQQGGTPLVVTVPTGERADFGTVTGLAANGSGVTRFDDYELDVGIGGWMIGALGIG